MENKLKFGVLVFFVALLPLFFWHEVTRSNRSFIRVANTKPPQSQAIDLTPGQVLTFEFPDLPPTLAGKTPRITLRLPDNYSPSEKYPLLIFLAGGKGGKGNDLNTPKKLMGTEDYIIGNFPLFGQSNGAEPFDGSLVGFDNYPAIATAFKAFMAQINESIPNIDTEQNVIGGFSNGAHTLAVMLSMLDPNFLANFKYVFFIDGGEDWAWAGLSRTTKLKNHHFLLVYGGGKPGKAEWWRQHTLNRAESYREFAQEWNLDLNVQVIKGFNHGFHKEFYPVVRRWLARS